MLIRRLVQTFAGSRVCLPLALFFAAALFFLPLSATAQTELQLGLTEGAHFATLKGGDRQQVAAPNLPQAELKRRPGLIIGGLVGLDFPGPLAAQSEVLWIWKGIKGTTDARETVTKLNYLEVPVLAKYRTPLSWGPISTHLLAGPIVGIGTKAVREQQSTVATDESQVTDRTELGEESRAVDVGVAVGGEVGYRFDDRATLNVDVRYRRSLTRTLASSDPSQGTGSAPDVWNQGVSVTLGFVFSTGWTF